MFTEARAHLFISQIAFFGVVVYLHRVTTQLRWNDPCSTIYKTLIPPPPPSLSLYPHHTLPILSISFCLLRPVSALFTGRRHCSARLEATGPASCLFTSSWRCGESKTMAPSHSHWSATLLASGWLIRCHHNSRIITREKFSFARTTHKLRHPF